MRTLLTGTNSPQLQAKARGLINLWAWLILIYHPLRKRAAEENVNCLINLDEVNVIRTYTYTNSLLDFVDCHIDCFVLQYGH